MNNHIIVQCALAASLAMGVPTYAGDASDGPEKWRAYAVKMEIKYALPTGLLVAICAQESNWENVLGAAGERGVCQVKPSTAAMVCAKCPNIVEMLDNPYTNILLAALYLQWIADNVSGNPAIMAGAYNAGHNHPAVRYMAQVGSRRAYALRGRNI